MIKQTAHLLILVFAALVAACGEHVDGVSEDDIRLVKTEPLQSHTNVLIGKARVINSNEPDFVPEQVAQSMLRQLEKWPGRGKKLAEGLYQCSGALTSKLLGDKSPCASDYDIEHDQTCIEKHRYGRKSVGQALTADRVDLNDDGVDDYIISDRYYCGELSANQSNVFFVMLSTPQGKFRLAYADWASYGLSVVEDKKSGKKTLIEQAPKTYGTYTRILHLTNGQYTPRICVLHDDKGYSRCDD